MYTWVYLDYRLFLLTVCIALFVSSLCTSSHYWRILNISWLATLNIMFYLVAQWPRLSLTRMLGLLVLLCTLALWSILLTPVQLLFQAPETRKSSATSYVLYDPLGAGYTPHEVKADVFAVHGLGSWPELAWEHADGVNWLRDLLPQDWPDMRVIAINHDSWWDAYSPVQSLRSYGDTILSSIESMRRDEDEQRRPLILVGHSFGGVLVKKALVIANEGNKNSPQLKIATNTRAVFFLGTPHKGSNYALLGTLASYFTYWRGSRSELLEFLTPSSKELEDLHVSFLRGFRDTYICNVYETLPIVKGPVSLYPVVARNSAVIDGYPEVALVADHRGLNKFPSRTDRNYRAVNQEIGKAREHIEKQLRNERNVTRYSVPFRLRGAARTASFVGRESELRTMAEAVFPAKYEQVRNIVVIHGLGGIGKSQLAIYFAIRHQEKFTSVFWVNCHTALTTRLGFASIAEQIPLPEVLGSNGKLLPDTTTIDAAILQVTNWLEASENDKWLLILDNVEPQSDLGNEADIEDDSDRFDIRNSLPSSSHGTIIMTTRYSPLAQLGTGVEVGDMDLEDGVLVFQNCAGTDVSLRDAEVIVKRLQGHPLAICQAGVNIKESAITTTAYLRHHEALLKKLTKKNTDLSYRNGSIDVSLELSFNAAMKRSPAGVRMLQLWGFLDNADFWWELLHTAVRCPNNNCKERRLQSPESEINGQLDGTEETTLDWLDDLARNETSFLEAIGVLHEFSLVRRVNDSDAYSIHPIVHDWARKSVDPKFRNVYLGAAISVLGRATPLAHHRDAWILQRRLAPHVDRMWALFDETSKPDFPFLPEAEGFYGLSYFEFDRSNFSRAAIAYEMACKGLESNLGDEDFLTVQCLHDAALTYRELGQYERAEKRWKWTYDQASRLESPNARTALRALDDLGRLASLCKDFETAVEYLERALQGKQTAWAHDIPYTYDTMRQLALAYASLGQLEKAEQMHREVLAQFEKELGPNHTWTLLAISDIGALYQRLGRFQEAEVFLQKAFATMRDQLGPANAKTREIHAALVAVLREQGREAEIEDLR